MRLAYFVLLFFNVAAWAHGQHFRTDYNYHYPAVEGWFKMHVIPKTWSEAYLQCHNEGAVLASPENRHILHAMKHIMTATKTTSGIFTGINDIYSSGNYHTVEGTAFSEIEKFITWEPNEPNNLKKGENTLRMLPDGAMAYVPSTILLPFICFRRRTQRITTECGTTDPEYSLNPLTGSCYKVHVEPQSWSRAYSVCSSEGGYLAIINSQAEAQALADLFANSTEIPGNFEKYLAFIGFRDFAEEGFYLTVHGQSLKEAGYAGWAGEYPSYYAKYHCGTIRHDGKLSDSNCEYKMLFICEKNPDSLTSEEEKYIVINYPNVFEN